MTITSGYRINPEGAYKMPSIFCRQCGLESFSPDDVKYKFCGRCNDYHAPSPTTIDLMLQSLEQAEN